MTLALMLIYSGKQVHGFYQEQLSSVNSVIEVRAGQNIVQVALSIQGQGLISKPRAYFLMAYAYLKGDFKKLKVGEYNAASISLYALLQRMIQGQVVQYSVTFIPGSTFKELLQTLHQHPKIKKTIALSSDATDLQSVINLLQPEFPNFLEGQFYPETYFFTAGTSDAALLKRAHALLLKKLDQLWTERDTSPQQQLKTKAEALILASIIQKESAKITEFEAISGVYQRRLSLKMPLQADPTVVYALELHQNVKNKQLKFGHLKYVSAYNTYLNAGLPPGPIGLVTEEAIKAALHPQPGSNLYFVADGSGGHQFSDSFEAHKVLADQYRKAFMKCQP